MSSPSPTKICFNSFCNDVLQNSSRKGWRRRTGEFADLCDRCASAYAEGKFCETFHLKACGWRCCESCGKKIHCGCIVSFHMFVLLDAGGIECLNCTRKSFILTPNPAWPPPSVLPVHPEKSIDLSSKSWSHRAGSGPIPWPQPSSVFSSSSAQTDLQPRNPFNVQRLGRIFSSKQLSTLSSEKKKLEDSSLRLSNCSFKIVTPGNLETGNSGITLKEQASGGIDASHKLSLPKNDAATSPINLSMSSISMREPFDQTEVIGNPAQPAPLLTGMQFFGHNGSNLYNETQSTSGKPPGDPRQRNHLLSRYSPRITDQELQKISADSNSVITPLFEKTLSVSDAGKIGRLVLPKRCAEAYLPPIFSPEGLPLQVQDSKGREWTLQFRFWPNNNSRMYVLEGVTPFIQSTRLQAGDIVTFSRIEPEGKLVMGFRKVSSALPSNQGSEPVNSCGVSPKPNHDITAKKTKNNQVLSTPNQLKVTSLSSGSVAINHEKSADETCTVSKGDEPGYLAKEVLGAKSNHPCKRRNSTMGSRSKRVRIESKDQIELKLTCEQAQALLRPPRNFVPTIVIIEDIELEEYEDAPIIGQPTFLTTDDAGKSIQWIQCEDCHKWRKVPADALLPSRWTCSENSWDQERSLCSVAEELTPEQLQDLLPPNAWVGSKKTKATKLDQDSADILEGLAGLANLAIQEASETLAGASSQAATTKHPRHRAGCTCIVCSQPPSGKGPKHNPTCKCNVCLTVKRRFKTLMLRREKKDAEKTETALRKTEQQKDLADEDTQVHPTVGNSSPNLTYISSSEDLANDVSRMGSSSSLSPLKGHIDLNFQPQKDEEMSTGLHSGTMMRLLQDASNKLLSSSPKENGVVSGDRIGTGLGKRGDDGAEAVVSSRSDATRSPS